MADNNQQQQQQKVQQQGKQTNGVSIALGVSPTDFSGDTLSRYFTIGVAALAGLFIINKVHGPIAKRLFGVKPEDKPAIQMNPGTIVDHLKSGAVPEGGMKFIAKEAVSALSDDGKKNLVEFLSKQLEPVNNNSNNN